VIEILAINLPCSLELACILDYNLMFLPLLIFQAFCNTVKLRQELILDKLNTLECLRQHWCSLDPGTQRICRVLEESP